MLLHKHLPAVLLRRLPATLRACKPSLSAPSAASSSWGPGSTVRHLPAATPPACTCLTPATQGFRLRPANDASPCHCCILAPGRLQAPPRWTCGRSRMAMISTAPSPAPPTQYMWSTISRACLCAATSTLARCAALTTLPVSGLRAGGWGALLLRAGAAAARATQRGCSRRRHWRRRNSNCCRLHHWRQGAGDGECDFAAMTAGV
jgi:hypothetical protein